MEIPLAITLASFLSRTALQFALRKARFGRNFKIRNIAPSLFLLAEVSACAGTITSGTGDRIGASISLQFSGSDFTAGASGTSSTYPCGPGFGPCLLGTGLQSAAAGLFSEDRGASGFVGFGNGS